MKATRRKLRGLARSEGGTRDDRFFWIASDDRYAAHQYLRMLAVPRVRIVPVEQGEETWAASRVVEALRRIETEAMMEEDQRWAILDVDHFGEASHLTGLMGALQEAGQLGIEVAISQPCFELWLLLHWVEAKEASGVKDAKEAEGRLRRAIGEYNKRNLKLQHYGPERMLAAVRRARELDSTTNGDKLPKARTTRMYRLIEALALAGHKRWLTGEWLQLREELESGRPG